MRYHILTDLGQETLLDLSADDDMKWSDFIELSQVQAIPGKIIDITPEGMPNRFTDEESMRRQLTNLGIKRSVNEKGISQYEEIDSDADSDQP